MEIIETEVKSTLERLSLLESKVDVDIDVNDYLQNWQKSFELKIASLIDTFVKRHVEEILEAAEAKPMLMSVRCEERLDAHRTDSDDEDEPDEILTEFLEPYPTRITSSHPPKVGPKPPRSRCICSIKALYIDRVDKEPQSGENSRGRGCKRLG